MPPKRSSRRSTAGAAAAAAAAATTSSTVASPSTAAATRTPRKATSNRPTISFTSTRATRMRRRSTQQPQQIESDPVMPEEDSDEPSEIAAADVVLPDEEEGDDDDDEDGEENEHEHTNPSTTAATAAAAESDDELAVDTPANDQGDDTDAIVYTTPRRTSSRGTPRGRGRGRGRGSRGARGVRMLASHQHASRQFDDGTPDPSAGDEADDASDAGTPAHIPSTARRRGRPSLAGGDDSGTPRRGWRGGFRGRARGWRARQAAADSTRQPVDKDGNALEVRNDEVVLPTDPAGELKVDANGVLQAGREYRVRTFTLAHRQDRLYMLSTEPARCTGFRDSYLFFTKHPHLYKIIIDDAEKRDLIDRDLIPHSYKGRAIGVVTARSVFREFGCKIVVAGKKVTDDYYEAEARARGDKEDEVYDPTDRVPAPGQTYNRNQYVAWHGASSVYHSAQTVVGPNGLAMTLALPRKKGPITSSNWMLEHALAAARYNERLGRLRKGTLEGTYDPHTNGLMYPAAMQPTRVRYEWVDNDATQPLENDVGTEKENGTKRVHDVMVNGNGMGSRTPLPLDPEVEEGSPAPKRVKLEVSSSQFKSIAEQAHDSRKEEEAKTTPIYNADGGIFPRPSRLLRRNFLVMDTSFETPTATVGGGGVSVGGGVGIGIGHGIRRGWTGTGTGCESTLPDPDDARWRDMDGGSRRALRTAREEEAGRLAAFRPSGEMSGTRGRVLALGM